MNTTIKQMLHDEYKRTLTTIAQTETDSNEAKWELQKLSELHKQIAEDAMNDNKCYLETRKMALEEKRAKSEKLMNTARIAVDGSAFLLQLIAAWTWMRRGLEFEQTGTFTSRCNNWVSNHFRLFKK